MISDLQRKTLALLTEVWALSPDVRLGQLFAHLGFLSESHLGRSLGYVDDDELMSILNRHRAELLARLEVPTNHALPSTGLATAVPESSKVAEAAGATEV